MDYMLPAQGERFNHPDGRAFIFTRVDPPDSLRKWWWYATALSGDATLQGNRKLRRCGLTNGWELK